MAGPFSLGVAEPAEGERRGRDEGSQLSMHGVITIDDVSRFIDDPDHSADLGGEIDFTAFGDAIAVRSGSFNLFSRAAEPDLKFMIYELIFEWDGEEYFLAGRKDVRNDPGFDLWTDTTTLSTVLHRGRDATGEVVGAGILTIGAGGLARMVSTMRASNAGSVAEQAQAVATFGRFFMGELWDSYRPVGWWGRLLRWLRLR
jgi:cholesterol oxidase